MEGLLCSSEMGKLRHRPNDLMQQGKDTAPPTSFLESKTEEKKWANLIYRNKKNKWSSTPQIYKQNGASPRNFMITV